MIPNPDPDLDLYDQKLKKLTAQKKLQFLFKIIASLLSYTSFSPTSMTDV
jgi:hypothetical protein